jgi:phospholipase/carboxylesterase
MRTEEISGLTCRFAGGVDGQGGGDGPVVVLLHGFGAPGDDLVPLWQFLAGEGTEVRFVFPAAPLELPMFFGESRAWWMIDTARLERDMAAGVERDLSAEVPEGLSGARELLKSVLATLVESHGASPERTVIGGFSQGAMLSTDVALRAATPYAGLLVLSGTYLCADQWNPLIESRAGMPVLQSHGRGDALLPFSMAERLRDRFTGAGATHTWVPFEGGHEIPMQVAEAARDFIHRVLGTD